MSKFDQSFKKKSKNTEKRRLIKWRAFKKDGKKYQI